ncbi:MAG: methylmalonyl Co-A mutase-associated GTPase MeaB [Bacteroidetes bacterium]|nr:methylmalonyl Co-A mutase-associated GTPase MeaB [Bacteroidota bacterium]
MQWESQLEKIKAGDQKVLAQFISVIENQQEGYVSLLESLPMGTKPVLGITGPPGAGKSTLVDKLIGKVVEDGKKIAVLCVDPSSPFHQGAILGDRIRMSSWYTHPDIYIRSLASRGSLGGLHPRIIEICELLQQGDFDWIIIETVGVGQSEIEIAGLADVTAVVLVPEGGDEIQTMKAGLMEIADLIVVNKADRPDTAKYLNHLKLMLSPVYARSEKEIPILPTTAITNEGVDQLYRTLQHLAVAVKQEDKQNGLLAEKAYRLIEAKRLHDIDRTQLAVLIKEERKQGNFNLYRFVSTY